jgi:hypothetical protein
MGIADVFDRLDPRPEYTTKTISVQEISILSWTSISSGTGKLKQHPKEGEVMASDR